MDLDIGIIKCEPEEIVKSEPLSTETEHSVTFKCTNENLPIDTPTQNEDHKVLDFDVQPKIEPLISMKVESVEELETDYQSTLEMPIKNKNEHCENNTKKVSLKDVLHDDQSNSEILQKELEQTAFANSKNRRARNSASCDKTSKLNTGMKTRYDCPYCNRNFTERDSFSFHLWISHSKQNPDALIEEFNKKNFACDICEFKSSCSRSFKSHMVMHEAFVATNTFKCNNCDYDTPRKSSMRNHIQTKHTNDRLTYSCRFCNQTFLTKVYLADHLLRQHGDKFDKSLKRLLSLTIKHCKFCDFRTMLKVELNQHISSHGDGIGNAGADAIIFKCNNCDYVTFKKCYLRSHIQKKHSNDRHTYSCRFCNKTVLRKASLAHHLLRQHGDKFDKSLKTLFSLNINHCKLCDFRTTWKFKLSEHMTKHSDSPVNAIFFKNGDYESSFPVNIQDKNSNDGPTYSCRFCNKTFSLKVSLAEHLLCQHGEKFEKSLNTLLSLTIKHCKLCDFRVIRKSVLNRHIQSRHSNNRPSYTYTCRFCNKTLCHKENLAHHLLLYHGDKFDKSLKTLLSLTIKHCKFCDFRVINKFKLNQHIQSKHSNI